MDRSLSCHITILIGWYTAVVQKNPFQQQLSEFFEKGIQRLATQRNARLNIIRNLRYYSWTITSEN